MAEKCSRYPSSDVDVVKAYFELCRIGNLPTVWTNVLAAGLLSGSEIAVTTLALLVLALSCLYAAGMCLNDICDIEYDRKHRPTRPLPAARLTIGKAKVLTVALFVSGWSLLIAAPDMAGAIGGLLLVGAIVAYDLRHKDSPISVVIMAACRAMVFVVTALAISGHVLTPVMLAAAVQFAYVLLVGMIARYENRLALPLRLPVVPLMLAGISLLDGILLAALISAPWILVGIAGALATLAGQRFARGD